MDVVVEVLLLCLWLLSDDVGDGILDWRKSYRGMGGGTLPLSEGSVLALPSTLLATPASDSHLGQNEKPEECKNAFLRRSFPSIPRTTSSAGYDQTHCKHSRGKATHRNRKTT